MFPVNFNSFPKNSVYFPNFQRALVLSALIMQLIQFRECTIKKALHSSERWKVKNKENSTVSQIPSSVLSRIEHYDNTSNTNENLQNPTIKTPTKNKNKKSHKKGFLESAMNYLQESKIIQSYAVKIKNDLSTFVEAEQEKLFSGRQFQTASVKPGWMESAMVPMAFITFAMFLMDIMQRMYPYYGGGGYGWGKGGAEYYDYYNRVQAPSATTDSSTSIKISSLFGRSSDYNKNAQINVKKQQRPSVNKYAKPSGKRPSQKPSQGIPGILSLFGQNKISTNNNPGTSSTVIGPDKVNTRVDVSSGKPFYYFL